MENTRRGQSNFDALRTRLLTDSEEGSCQFVFFSLAAILKESMFMVWVLAGLEWPRQAAVRRVRASQRGRRGRPAAPARTRWDVAAGAAPGLKVGSPDHKV